MAENRRYDQRVPIPEETLPERTTTFGEILHSYLPDGAVLEGQRCLQCAMPYCIQACPIAQDARGYIGLIAQRRFDEAAIVALRENPLATTLCKVCYHYCEDACIMAERGVPIAIRQLKRAAMELGDSELFYVAAPSRNRKVAIVGGGPAGLMAAWELGLRGYSVTVFEEQAFLGGQAATIPKYHADGDEIEVDVARFRNLDVTFAMGKKVGPGLPVEDLLKTGFGAVYVAIGTSDHRSAGLLGENLPGVYPALDLLRDINQGPPKLLGSKIVVVGGGDVAMDAVRSAVRLAPGGTVTLVYHRTRDKMAAGLEEVEGGEIEGAHFVFDRAPVRIVGTGHVEGLVIQQATLSPPGPSGRPTVVGVPGTEETIPCDTVILAVGEKADLTGFPPGIDFQFGRQGWPEGRKADTMTGIEGIFASGGRSVVHAMAAGTRSAEAIDAYLRKKDGLAPAPRPDPFGGPNPPRRPLGYETPTWQA